MGDYFLGEIRMFSWNWAPKGWALCNGANLPVNQNAALYALLGVSFGGTANVNFNLPDLRGRAPVAMGISADKQVSYAMGNNGGGETVGLTAAQLPAHQHMVIAANDPATVGSPSDNYLAQPAGVNLYANPTSTPAVVALDPKSVSVDGGGGPHANMQPFLVMNYCISITGLFPSRS